ncbi:MAG TPA: DMT family transporter [Ferrovibrio sp.]|jgi:drug/metabolite transporter (DMT)-like permease|uniref:DMT family transporter n=1 Tax=Ferrovibrio sp. TaxID=1917215 RepID=UPI002ED689B0
MTLAVPYRLQPNVPLGIGYMVLAVSLFGCMDALVKWLVATYPTVQIMFFRSFCAFPPILAMAAQGPRGFAILRSRRLVGHGLRSVYGLAAMLGFFFSYSFMPLADVTAISFSGPIFIAFLSIWLLREKVGLHRWSAILVGFVGMIVIIRPGQGLLHNGALIVVGATLLYALAMIQIRKLSETEPSTTTAFYFTAFCTLITGLLLPWFWVTPRLGDLPLLVGVGLIGGTAQLFMTRAYGLAPASVAAPFDYTHLIWSVLFGWYIWGDFPDLQTWIGCAIVVASGLYILYRETVRRQRVPRMITE